MKDKYATTTQYISIPIRYSKQIQYIENKNIKILNTYKHSHKISIGELQGNRFQITLKEVDEKNLNQIYSILSKIQKHGIPNYFGYQRFGNETNFKQVKDIVYGEEFVKDKQTDKMMTSIYQSYFFNAWLAKRIELAFKDKSNKLTLLDGDIFYDLSTHKTFSPNKLQSILEQYDQKKIVPSGLLPGRKVYRCTKKSREIEELFDDEFIHDKGFRRPAWIYPKNITNQYNEKNQHLVLSFELPKGSYATILIENLLNKNLKAN